MAPKQHLADLADIEKIATATHFSVHLRSGPHDKITKRAKTLAAAIRTADAMGKTASGRRPLIYAITPDKMTVHVPAAMIAQARQDAATGAGRGRAAHPGEKGSNRAARRAAGSRAEVAGNAAKGILPPVPDFSAEMHRRYRGELAEIVALVEAGDVAALKAFPINPYSSSPKAMAWYRDLAMQVIEVRSGF